MQEKYNVYSINNEEIENSQKKINMKECLVN